MRKVVLGFILVALAAAGGWQIYLNMQPAPLPSTPAEKPAPPEGFVLPTLSVTAELGERSFDENCIACHGAYGLGTENGPPLVHRIYEPNHHGDIAFLMAVRNGVQAHHWTYGNMPSIDGLSEQEVANIVTYVRALQKANNIF
ncbi:c-type cytochrome [Maritalea mediterranea]|uniref:Cytochrome c n=1 Tax=Maritalea mediterranea TaxID=2909667 RepID=A0ABS9E377_9HYPH|nr:cytochrome c [Maritalea mediterranea]MCF4097330.1 cytochrome c [Maritalea mediterranea]